MEKIKRITNFRNLGLGFFLHFGLYNQIGKGEWYGNMYGLSTKEYYQCFKKMNELNLKLNLKQIVKTAKNNNFKYLVLTTKHHDGFCLFDSKGMSEYDLTKTATKTDFIQEFIQECQQNKLIPILYYCTMDWTWDESGISFADQLKKINQEIELLCQTYQGIGGFWFDGNWSRKDADWEEEKLYQIIRRYFPEAIIVNNSGLTNAGKEQKIDVDVLTFEQGHLKDINYQNFKRDLAAEASQTFNDHWGIAVEDYNHKSLSYLILKFVEAREQKANFLLNVSLTKNGNLVSLEKETINFFGKWVKKYGYMLFQDYEIIAIDDQDFIIKTKDDQYFAFLHHLPSGGHVKVIQQGGKIQPNRSFKLKKPISESIEKMSFLDNGEEISFVKKEKELIITPTAFNYGFNTIVRVVKIFTK